MAVGAAGKRAAGDRERSGMGRVYDLIECVRQERDCSEELRLDEVIVDKQMKPSVEVVCQMKILHMDIVVKEVNPCENIQKASVHPEPSAGEECCQHGFAFRMPPYMA